MSRDPRSAEILSVAQLTARIQATLEGAFPAVWVAGEISGMSRPQSGHIYLTLKDETAQIRAAIWRSTASRLPFKLEEGQQVICCGGLDVFPPRGSYQLIVRQIEPKGEGALQLAFRQLKAKLAAEGLFDESHKKPLPLFPRRIAFVTSPTGAAIRDFLEVLRRRWQGADVLIVPARVQGEEAVREIVRGIRAANRLADPPDVLIVGRGGGSPEDLWCFNDEAVVRAIFASRIPVVSAVGHEIDVTLSDFVADRRALTPSEAAELVVPSGEEILTGLRSAERRLAAALRRQASLARIQLAAFAQRRVFRRPFDVVQIRARGIDDLQVRAQRAVSRALSRNQDQIASLAARLETLSPLAVLARGYSLTQRAATGELIVDSTSVEPGDLITTRFSQGQIRSRVEQIDA